MILFATSLMLALQQNEPAPMPRPVEISEAQKWAKETGYVAGSAKFCKFEEDVVEHYISRAYAKIAHEATDKEDLIVARIDFSNSLNSASSQKPRNGCEAFKEVFKRENTRF